MKRSRTWIPALVGLLVAGGAVWFWRSRSNEQAPAARSTSLAAVERRNLEIAAEASGLVEPIRVVEVKSRASGEVLRVLVDTGDRIDGGALLAEIDPRDVQNALAQAGADLESARVQRDTAEAHRARMEELRRSAAVTQQEYETAVQSAASARAAVVRAETNLQLARIRGSDVTIRAPIEGTVLSRSVQPGQIIASATNNVSGGTALFSMADLSEMQVRAKVDETDIGQIAPGQTAQVSVEAYPGRVFVGQVFKIEPQAIVEQNVTLFPVLVRLENPQGLLRPGMNAEVKVQIARKAQALVVPNSAVVTVRDARAAAATLGLEEGAMRGPERGDGGAGGASSPECQRLFEQMRGGGGPAGLSEADRTALRACREQRGGGRGQGASAKGEQRPAYVFVQGPGGYEPRRVVLGLSDWEYTEVLEGLEGNEQVVLISVAQMQKQQQQVQDRMRQRAGGGILGPGSGGAAPRGRGGG